MPISVVSVRSNASEEIYLLHATAAPFRVLLCRAPSNKFYGVRTVKK
jgi:hypothetical protein